MILDKDTVYSNKAQIGDLIPHTQTAIIHPLSRYNSED